MWAIPSSKGKLLGSWLVLWVYCATDLFKLFAILGSYIATYQLFFLE